MQKRNPLSTSMSSHAHQLQLPKDLDEDIPLTKNQYYPYPSLHPVPGNHPLMHHSHHWWHKKEGHTSPSHQMEEDRPSNQETLRLRVADPQSILCQMTTRIHKAHQLRHLEEDLLLHPTHQRRHHPLLLLPPFQHYQLTKRSRMSKNLMILKKQNNGTASSDKPSFTSKKMRKTSHQKKESSAFSSASWQEDFQRSLPRTS